MTKLLSMALVLTFTTGYLVGCTDTSTVKDQTEIKTPGGTTTITKEKEIEKTGDHKDDGVAPVTPRTP
jgi:hypothetical protein